MNRKLKERNLSNIYIYLITILARVREIKNDIYKIYLFNEKNKNERIIIIKTILREIYLVDKLVINILLRNNILILKEINHLFFK